MKGSAKDIYNSSKLGKLRVLSLFSGIGAFEKALSNIGVNYDLVGFSEIDKWAITSYCAIHGVDKSLNLGDIAKISNKDLPKSDLVTYGFPCQDISVAGKQEGIKKGTRSGLLFQAERIIKITRPKYAVAENVKNLIGKSHIEDFKELLKRLDSYGYNSYYGVLNARSFGIPQNRERVFIISIRKDIDKESYTKDKFFNVKGKAEPILEDFLEDVVEDRYYHISKSIKINLMREYDEVLKTNKPSYYLETKSGFQDNNISIKYAKTIRASNRNLLIRQAVNNKNKDFLRDPKDKYVIRNITPLEAYRLMGFTDEDYCKARKALMEEYYNGRDRTSSQMYKQAGNSIVVPVLEHIFKVLLDVG